MSSETRPEGLEGASHVNVCQPTVFQEQPGGQCGGGAAEKLGMERSRVGAPSRPL